MINDLSAKDELKNNGMSYVNIDLESGRPRDLRRSPMVGNKVVPPWLRYGHSAILSP